MNEQETLAFLLPVMRNRIRREPHNFSGDGAARRRATGSGSDGFGLKRHVHQIKIYIKKKTAM
jgi:hypothetical protein